MPKLREHAAKAPQALRAAAQFDFRRLFQSRTAQRLVTVHGDFHCGNSVRSRSSELKVIDLEFVSVACAVFDLAACNAPGPYVMWANTYPKVNANSPVGVRFGKMGMMWEGRATREQRAESVSYTHLTLPTTPYV